MQAEPNLPQIWIKPFYRSFNGIRGLAALAVFFHHLGHLLAPSNLWAIFFSGNDLFFVLSGFLITGILFDSVHEPAYFKNFYIRRALRIFPLYYAFFAALILARILLPIYWHGNLLLFAAYVANLTVPFTDLGQHNPTMIYLLHHGARHEVANIGVLWSLCVEEQFYLLWPALVWWIRDRRRLMQLCAGLIVAIFLFRLFLCWRHAEAHHVLLIFWSTYTRADTLLIGGWLALWLRGQALTRAQLRTLGTAAVAVGMIVFWAPFHFRFSRLDLGSPRMESIGFAAVGILYAGVLLLSIEETSPLARLLRWTPLERFGRISYGFYIFHALFAPVLNVVASRHPWTGPWLLFLDFVAVVTFASISFRFYESPFLALKGKLAPQQRAAHPHVPVPQPAVAG